MLILSSSAFTLLLQYHYSISELHNNFSYPIYLDVVKGYHFIRLLSNDAACWRILRQNNIISIIIRLHPLDHELPNQASTNSSTSCKVVDVGINGIQECIPCTDTISLVFARFSKFRKNHWLIYYCLRVCQMARHPSLHESHLWAIILSGQPVGN